MGQFDYLTSLMTNRKNDYLIYICPICGTENSMNSTECRMCKHSLVEFESLFYSRFNLYNEALDSMKADKLLNAYEKIITFLNFYPKDIDAQHLRFYLMYLLNSTDFLESAEEYMQTNSDRWLANIIDAPEKISISDFPYKTKFMGKSIFQPFDKLVNAKQEERIKFAMQIKDVINHIYDIYRKIKTKKNKNAFISEFMLFYEKIFIDYLIKCEMNVIDYLGKNYNELSDDEQKSFDSVVKIENNRIKNGYIVKVFMPEIRYHSIIIQRAKIAVNVNKNAITRRSNENKF